MIVVTAEGWVSTQQGVKDAASGPDVAFFILDMQKELDVHMCSTRNHWTVVEKDEAQGKSIVKAIWSFKRKQNLEGIINKYKACLCAYRVMKK